MVNVQQTRKGTAMSAPLKPKATDDSCPSRRPDIISRTAQPVAFGAALTNTWTGVRLAGIGLADFLLVTAIVLILLTAAVRRSRLPLFSWAALPPITLLLIAFAGSILRGDPLSSTRGISEWSVNAATGAAYGGAIPLVIRLTLSLTAVSIVVAGLSTQAHDRRAVIQKLMYAWAVGAGLSAAYGVMAYLPIMNALDLRNLPFLSYFSSPYRATGLAHHPNSFGITISLALPMLMHLASITRKWTKFFTILLIALSMYAIFLSGSRAALLGGSILGLATLTYHLFSTKRAPIWAILSAVFVLPAVASIVPKAIEGSRLFSKSAQISNAARASTIQRAIELFKDNPIFGSGVGSWTGEFVPLIIATSGGLLFFAIFYTCLSYPLIRVRHLRSSFTSILFISAIGVLGFGLLNNGVAERYLYWPFAALFALGLGGNEGGSKNTDSPGLVKTPLEPGKGPSRNSGQHVSIRY